LGISPNFINLIRSDSLLTPVDLGSYSSRVTMMVGNAARESATKMRLLISQTLAPELGVSPHDLVFANNRIYPSQSPEKGISFEEALHIVVRKIGEVSTAGAYTPPKPLGDYKGRGVGPSPAYSFNACCVLLTVDTETGKTRVEKVWLAHDIGKVLHRKSAEGQVVGSVYMALGEVFMEEQAFLSSGVHRCPSMLEYKSPTFLEMPEVEVFFIEDGDPEGPFGAKEVGQGPLLPVVPATLNALYDAIGVRFDEIPVTPEKILFALQRKVQRVGPKFYPPFSFPPPLKVSPPEGF
ncbi:MAG: xanthine dehydrogenase family protein molybdopterin-binding subunit, partial [bacterium]